METAGQRCCPFLTPAGAAAALPGFPVFWRTPCPHEC